MHGSAECVPVKDNDLVSRLIFWAHALLRELPWRTEPREPYRTWVSEVMLQQTQAATVVPYFARFVERFPDVQTLAAAPLDDVLKAWEGLGYYSRARNLHKAAQVVVADHGGQLPPTVKDLLKLPGIGRYTAGAIASIAFGQDAPVLDGNVKRVLCRLFAIQDDLRLPATQKRLWELAESLLPPGQAGAFNEALMELGALVCTPRAPDCVHCPLAGDRNVGAGLASEASVSRPPALDRCQEGTHEGCPYCQAYAQGIVEALPLKAKRKPIPHYDVTAAVIRKSGKFLIAQRPHKGMLGGLWEFPGGKCQDGETLPDCLRREIEEELGIKIKVGKRITIVKHVYSHMKISLHAFACRHVSGRVRTLGVADWHWVTLDELERFAFPVTDQKIIAVLKK
jgi:A/G-specific adenine glycosylase